MSGSSAFGDCSVWAHPDYPDYTLVNFDPTAYSAFVQNTITPQQLCYAYYYECLSNRNKLSSGRRLPTLDKQQLYNVVANMHHLTI